ncbi:MAG TPA: 3-keto-5-aminohexanoate cleavage protein [Beijerinckiaceae bacterium]|jgi:uncharacterized protein (DUF849 family)|nr:hypothetical protein [Microvirga sp.]HZB37274.1 3-keto-5-aminohexanoate cleavage protein [Beijerinckiaceae bacterium]
MSRKTVITCALTGSFDTPSKNPAVPVTPEQIATSALDAAKAGAAVVHIHVRDPKTTKPSMELSLYREVVERIRDKNDQVVLNLTTGPGGRFIPDPAEPRRAGEGTTLTTPAARMRHVEELKPPICTLDVATMNFGEHAFLNMPAHLREMADRAKAAGAKPEIEVFDLGHIELAKRLIAEGHLAEPPLFQICLGIPYGAPATPDTLLLMRDQLPKNAAWSAFGISRAEFPMVAVTVAAGGNVRVGLEDNLYLGKGKLAPSNAALVERAATIIELLDASVATPKEAREIFGLSG